MCISDWSSDVCSSDLRRRLPCGAQVVEGRPRPARPVEPGAQQRARLLPVAFMAKQAGGIEPAVARVVGPALDAVAPGAKGGHFLKPRIDRQSAVSGKRVQGRVERWDGRTRKKNKH